MKKHIPNIITCCNLVSGCVAVTFALSGQYALAFLFIVIGAVFDFFDGMTARLLHVVSPIGRELDSLADDITFGLAPSAMVFHLLYMMAPAEGALRYVPYLAFVMAAFSGYRLAVFNLDSRQTSQFIGLPTPANALFWASLITGAGEWLAGLPSAWLWIILTVAVSSWLLVSDIPMLALKFKTWGRRGNEVRYLFLIVSIPLLCVFRLSGFAVVIVWYVILSSLTQKKTN